MTEIVREYRAVRGQHNSRAVCSVCRKHAGETRMSYCCVDLVDKQPFRCDACRDLEHRVTRILREQTFGQLGDIQPSHRLDQLDASVYFPVCVTCALDEEFDIELPDDAIKATDTVADVIATVGALVGEVAR